MKTCTIFLSALMCLLTNCLLAQQGAYLGQDQLPSSSDSTAALQNYGVLGDFSGGYHVGDFAADFTVYDLDGNSLNLYDKLAGDKPVVICSGSASCIRYSDCFTVADNDFNSTHAREFMEENVSTFEWISIYNMEAHPADLDECTSNCPAISIPAPNGEYIYQHQTYGERQEALQMWMDIVDDPAYNCSFPFTAYVDNPNNGVYNTFFERPFGILVLNCEGEVIARGDWAAKWLGEEGGIAFLNDLATQEYNVCDYEPECEDTSTDTDGDGICDELEEYQGSAIDDPCDPDGTDSDEDGYCDIEEILNGWDPFDSNDPDMQTSIDESSVTEVIIYPNPAQDKITVRAEAEVDQWRVVDTMGREVINGSPKIKQFEIDLTPLLAGTYILYTSSSEHTLIDQIIKR